MQMAMEGDLIQNQKRYKEALEKIQYLEKQLGN